MLFVLLSLSVSCPTEEKLKSVQISSFTENELVFLSIPYPLLSLPNDTYQYIIMDLEVEAIREVAGFLQKILANLPMTHFKCEN